MFELNGTFVIFVLSFLVFMYLLNEIMLKPVRCVLELRAQKIQSDLTVSRSYRAQADETLATYEKNWHDVRHQAQGIINSGVDSATKHRNERMSAVHAEGKQKLEELQSEIAREHAHLIDQLIPNEVALINELTEKLLGEKVSLQLEPEYVKRTLQEVS